MSSVFDIVIPPSMHCCPMLSYVDRCIISHVITLSHKYLHFGGCNLTNSALARAYRTTDKTVSRAIAKAHLLGWVTFREDIQESYQYTHDGKEHTGYNTTRRIQIRINKEWEVLGDVYISAFRLNNSFTQEALDIILKVEELCKPANFNDKTFRKDIQALVHGVLKNHEARISPEDTQRMLDEEAEDSDPKCPPPPGHPCPAKRIILNKEDNNVGAKAPTGANSPAGRSSDDGQNSVEQEVNSETAKPEIRKGGRRPTITSEPAPASKETPASSAPLKNDSKAFKAQPGSPREALLAATQKHLNPNKPKPALPSLAVTPAVQQMISYWNGTGLPKLGMYRSRADEATGTRTKNFDATVYYLHKFLGGSLYSGGCKEILLPDGVRPFAARSFADFKLYVDRLVFRAFDESCDTPGGLRAVLKKTTLLGFIAGTPAMNITPVLLRYSLTVPPKLADVKALDPRLLQDFISTYESFTRKKASPSEQVILATATNRFIEFFNSNRGLMKFYTIQTPKELFDEHMVPAIREYWGKGHIASIGPKYLASISVYQRDLVKHMIGRGMIEDVDDLTIPA